MVFKELLFVAIIFTLSRMAIQAFSARLRLPPPASGFLVFGGVGFDSLHIKTVHNKCLDMPIFLDYCFCFIVYCCFRLRWYYLRHFRVNNSMIRHSNLTIIIYQRTLSFGQIRFCIFFNYNVTFLFWLVFSIGTVQPHWLYVFAKSQMH